MDRKIGFVYYEEGSPTGSDGFELSSSSMAEVSSGAEGISSTWEGAAGSGTVDGSSNCLS